MKGGVEGFDAIGSEEENTLKIFQQAEEDTYERIALNILWLSCL